MNTLAIVQVNLIRLIRYRTGLFFVFLLPIVLIVVLGTIYGGRVAPRLGIVSAGSGPLGAELVTAITHGDMQLEIRTFDARAELRDAVESGTVELGLVIPAGYDTALRGGETATVAILSQPAAQIAMRQGVAAAVSAQSARVRAARLAASTSGIPFDQALATADRVATALPGVDVAAEDVGKRLFPAGLGMFSLGAQSQLILFMFLTSMTAATQLILTRQLGVSMRMLASPTSVTTIIVGEALGRFAVAMVQGVFIVVLSAVMFGVDWGDPVAAGALVVAFALVGTGAAMVIGAFSNNADQAGTAGVFLGMLLGALGGAMVPIELFGDTMRSVAHLTPHAWAVDGFRTLVFDHGGLAQIATPLAVLLAMSGGLLALAIWKFRGQLVR